MARKIKPYWIPAIKKAMAVSHQARKGGYLFDLAYIRGSTREYSHKIILSITIGRGNKK